MHPLTRQFLLSQITLLEQQAQAIKSIIMHTPDETGSVLAVRPPEASNATIDQKMMDDEIGRLFQDFQPQELPPLETEGDK